MEKSIRLGNGDNIVLDMLGNPERFVLGRGGYGTVITVPEHMDIALKISTELDVCPSWSKEFEVQKRVFDAYESRTGVVKVVKPIQFAYIEKNRCYILMQRICPPPDLPQLEAVHATMGEIKTDTTHLKRGRFVGQSVLREYLNLDLAAVDMGVFLATVHFKLGLDGLDLEYIVGKLCGSTGAVDINVIDFGMVGDYERDRASRSITAVAYFPLSDACDYEECTEEEMTRNKTLSALFANAYIKEAGKYDGSEEAKEVLKLTV